MEGSCLSANDIVFTIVIKNTAIHAIFDDTFVSVLISFIPLYL